MAMGRICLLTPGNLASNPRLVKEADALHAAGYDVTAVVCSHADALGGFDADMAARAPWNVRRAPPMASDRPLRPMARIAAKALLTAGARIPPALAAAAYGVPSRGLAREAAQVKADLYIAHYIAALPAAAAAARRHGAMLGFDAEDFHSGEGTGGRAEDFRMRMAAEVERGTVPRCAHLTAAAPLIGRAYGARYGTEPRTLLNVFPLAMAPAAPMPRHSVPGRLRAYWFSQTIGLDRGLQQFLQAIARARAPIELDIRGSNRWGHGDALMTLARELGVGERVKLLPMASPDSMVQLAASYDIGLSLELELTESRRLCLTNKIFTYLLAGIPVMMSDTPAQSALAPALGVAAALVSLADPDGTAAVLDRLAGSPAALDEAKATAWRLGRERYNWDLEQRKLVAAVGDAFEKRHRGQV